MTTDSQTGLLQSPSSCPISTLINRKLSDMDDKELEAYSREIRELQRNDEKLSDALGGKKTKAKSNRVAKAKLGLGMLGL